MEIFDPVVRRTCEEADETDGVAKELVKRLTKRTKPATKLVKKLVKKRSPNQRHLKILREPFSGSHGSEKFRLVEICEALVSINFTVYR